jgi:hypothetical protein
MPTLESGWRSAKATGTTAAQIETSMASFAATVLAVAPLSGEVPTLLLPFALVPDYSPQSILSILGFPGEADGEMGRCVQ